MYGVNPTLFGENYNGAIAHLFTSMAGQLKRYGTKSLL
jgi:hypothetical protein